MIEVPANLAPPYGMITSQTCDIAEEDARRPVRPWVQIAPVFDRSDLSDGIRTELSRGKGARYLLHLPALPDGFWVADLRLEVPVEKGWLAKQAPLRGFPDEAGARIVGERIAHLRSRPAFAGRFVAAVQMPLRAALQELKRRAKADWARMHAQILEIGVSLDSLLDPHFAELTLLLDETELDTDLRRWWQEWWDSALPYAQEQGVQLLPLVVRSTAEVTLAEYRRMTRLPLDRLSPD